MININAMVTIQILPSHQFYLKQSPINPKEGEELSELQHKLKRENFSVCKKKAVEANFVSSEKLIPNR